MAAVGKLKELKESFKKVAGSDYDANKKPASGAAAAAPPGEAILARTDATGAGAGVEGAYEAEMMEALAACGD